jgi:hypothetical protein
MANVCCHRHQKSDNAARERRDPGKSGKKGRKTIREPGGNVMAATDILSGPLSYSEHRAQLRKAVIASTVGTTIEMVRFPTLQRRHRLGLRQGLLSPIRPARRRVASVRRLHRRLCRSSDRRLDFRPLRRPHRPQSGVDCDSPPSDARLRTRTRAGKREWTESSSCTPTLSRWCWKIFNHSRRFTVLSGDRSTPARRPCPTRQT